MYSIYYLDAISVFLSQLSCCCSLSLSLSEKCCFSAPNAALLPRPDVFIIYAPKRQNQHCARPHARTVVAATAKPSPDVYRFY